MLIIRPRKMAAKVQWRRPIKMPVDFYFHLAMMPVYSIAGYLGTEVAQTVGMWKIIESISTWFPIVVGLIMVFIRYSNRMQTRNQPKRPRR